ncbi:ATP synthase subunit I [Paenibacillus motobuensis]|uniref:ATP synthase subunit I n=1 Tax=Paenibacillus TaxID=44249 RepID=UPI002041C4DB|nr:MULTISPECIES: ATP synthase subunit I [Paenibacillus]MCM3040985.1 ATP synthase subunit I [Paenibacillus lutimineralis]MCM3648089.1 ATP synthase subunit I [Paenibacillus motobuensis]
MDDLNSIVSAVTRTTLLILSALFFGWAFFPDYRPMISGVILGLAVGLVYTRFLSMKVRGLAEYVISQQEGRFSFGFLTRICLVLLVIMVAVKVEQVSVLGVVIGLFVPQLLTIPISIVIGARNKS